MHEPAVFCLLFCETVIFYGVNNVLAIVAANCLCFCLLTIVPVVFLNTFANMEPTDKETEEKPVEIDQNDHSNNNSEDKDSDEASTVDENDTEASIVDESDAEKCSRELTHALLTRCPEKVSGLIRMSYEKKLLPSPHTSEKLSQKTCDFCGTDNTPMWRRGPRGCGELCNACGVKWKHALVKAGILKAKDKLPQLLKSSATSPRGNSKGVYLAGVCT